MKVHCFFPPLSPHSKIQTSFVIRHASFPPLIQVEKTIPLENIQDVTFIEGPILRHFHLSTLKFETAGHSAGQANDMHLTGIIDAHAFRDQILAAREALKLAQRGDRPPPPPRIRLRAKAEVPTASSRPLRESNAEWTKYSRCCGSGGRTTTPDPFSLTRRRGRGIRRRINKEILNTRTGQAIRLGYF